MSASQKGLSSRRLRFSNDGEAETLRFVERAGLLSGISTALPFETPAGGDLRRRMAFIEATRGLGFEVHELRDLLDIVDNVRVGGPAPEATITAQVDIIDQKIIALMRLRKQLLQMQDCSRDDSWPGHHSVQTAPRSDIGD